MSENNNKSFGLIIKEILTDKGLNQSLIAKKMNVSRQVINQIDRRKNFDYQFLKDLEKATGIDFTVYAPIPEYLRKAVHIENKIDEPEREHNVKAATITMNFEIPPNAYANLSEFMKEINLTANKHGLKVL